MLGQYPGFVSVDGTAEATGLPDSSIDLIVAGRAFHWFDRAPTRKEFVRISRPGATVALIWNERLMETPFEREYEELILRYAGDYKTVNHKNIADLQVGDFLSRSPLCWINLITFRSSIFQDCRGDCCRRRIFRRPGNGMRK
ncbi:class I SAM-dependent methyltransferase [Puia sp. P3]|uniref:class I SAM-dependent methyltransferase n=1 Tax=Puia sp. P3 TaxID=3423952 RepID=UPI003D667E19